MAPACPLAVPKAERQCTLLPQPVDELAAWLRLVNGAAASAPSRCVRMLSANSAARRRVLEQSFALLAADD